MTLVQRTAVLLESAWALLTYHSAAIRCSNVKPAKTLAQFLKRVELSGLGHALRHWGSDANPCADLAGSYSLEASADFLEVVLLPASLAEERIPLGTLMAGHAQGDLAISCAALSASASSAR